MSVSVKLAVGLQGNFVLVPDDLRVDSFAGLSWRNLKGDVSITETDAKNRMTAPCPTYDRADD